MNAGGELSCRGQGARPDRGGVLHLFPPEKRTRLRLGHSGGNASGFSGARRPHPSPDQQGLSCWAARLRSWFSASEIILPGSVGISPRFGMRR